MANDRIWMVCKRCDAAISIYKFYPFTGFIGGGYTSADTGERISTFLNHHLCACYPDAHDQDLKGDAGVTLITESHPDFLLEGKAGEWFVRKTAPMTPARITLFNGRLVILADGRPTAPWVERVSGLAVWLLAGALGVVLALWIGVGP